MLLFRWQRGSETETVLMIAKEDRKYSCFYGGRRRQETEILIMTAEEDRKQRLFYDGRRRQETNISPVNVFNFFHLVSGSIQELGFEDLLYGI